MTTRQTLDLLRAFESRNVTFLDPDGSWPIVWDRARGVHVWDADGKKYLDLTAAFGVAATGHANSAVVRAGQKQMSRLLHAMGDVHPHALKAQLARELSRLTFERWSAAQDSQIGRQLHGKTIFCNSGFEAVEAALKSARLATNQPGVIAFTGAYHGLGYGALNLTHRDHFRGPFLKQLREFGHFVPFPIEAPTSLPTPSPGARTFSSASASGARTFLSALQRDPRERTQLSKLHHQVTRLFRRHDIGAIVVEPIQGRGGINIPPPGFLPLLRALCDEHGAWLIVDEIYTGFGRTGAWFACEHSETVPDAICLGKALTGGFPLSACVGRADLMDAAWPPSAGEAIHTSTFLGHPVGCAMALAQIREIESRNLVQRSAELGEWLLAELQALAGRPVRLRLSARGYGLLAGLELRKSTGKPATEAAVQIIKKLLHRGFILLPEGEYSNVISFCPPLIIRQAQLRAALDTLAEFLKAGRS